MRIFLSTGEPSGDLHAANLIESLRRRRPDAEFVGFGGPHMEKAGARVLFPLVNLAIMWFGRVLLNIHKFFGLLFRADQCFKNERPDAVVLIDYPGFHWWVAWRAKVRQIPVFYYVPPQIWAWGGWRVKKVRKYVDHVLCSLPFEEEWYHQRDVPGATYIGHPYFDELAERTLDEGFLADQRRLQGRLVAILPGSRTQEVQKNLPTMIRAARKLSQGRSDVRFAVACLHERHQAIAREIVAAEGGNDLPLEVHAAKTPELIRLAEVAWAVSGSVGLELMVEALPSVILYKTRHFDLVVARQFIKARFISLVNLLADAEVMPEYLTADEVSGELAGWARSWLDDPAAYAKTKTALANLRDRIAVPGASDRAAGMIIEVIERSGTASPKTYRGLHDPSKQTAVHQEAR